MYFFFIASHLNSHAGGGEGGEIPSLKKHSHSLHMDTQQTLNIPTVVVFIGLYSPLFFLPTLLLMPQWIKIQSCLELNNTQNIQHILECFTVRVLSTSSGSTGTSDPEKRGPRPHSNHKCFLPLEIHQPP